MLTTLPDITASLPGSDFATLCKEVRAADLLRRRPGSYARRCVLTFGAYAVTALAVLGLGNSWGQAVVAVVAGIVFTQVAFLGHDGGHQQVFRSRRANDIFGRVIADLLLGLSYGWWVAKHNRHHADPNKEGSDPDIGEGVLAFTTGQAAARTGWLGRAVIRRQAWLFFPMLTLEGLNLHAASLLSLRRAGGRSRRGGRRSSELAMLSLHFAVYLTGLLLVMSPAKAAVFIVIHQAVWGLYMGCSFAPNHKGMPIIAEDEDLDFLRRQVVTSRNVSGGMVTDLVLGGLNYQIEHHLFPSLPRAALRDAQVLVRAHCLRLGIPYCETSLVDSYRAALSHLHAIGAPLRA